MKFYGHGIVWDAENNKVLCRFVGGEIETEDNRVVSEMMRLGYKNEATPKPPLGDTGTQGAVITTTETPSVVTGAAVSPAPDPADRANVMKSLDALGIAYSRNASTPSLLKKLNGGA